QHLGDMGQECLYGLGHPQRETVAAEPRHGLAQRRDRVVVVDHGPVAGTAAGDQPQPLDALLGRLDQVQAQVVVDRVREAADLADRLGAALEQLRMVVDHEVPAVAATGLLVSEEREDQVARGNAALPPPLADDREDHRVEVFHVDRAATPEVAILDLAGERVHRPLAGVGRNDVEVAVYQQGSPAAVGAFVARHDADPPRGALPDLRGQADLGQLGRPILRGGALTGGGGGVTGVGGVDPQQVATDLDHLVDRCGVAAGRRRGVWAHTLFLPARVSPLWLATVARRGRRHVYQLNPASSETRASNSCPDRL